MQMKLYSELAPWWLDLCKKAGFQPEIRTVRSTQAEVLETEVVLCHRPG